MLTSVYKDCTLPRLGFGTMRLPLASGEPNAPVDEKQVFAMVDYAMEHGINYFDTAYPYHGGQSEVIVGRALSRYPRESYYLADKFPGHQISASYDPAAIFEEQLQKCGVEYFDFYLLHNVYESSMQTYMSPKWGILDYFREQRRNGRIRRLGFSSHGLVGNLREFLDLCDDMEFCQIQLNYLDWTLQDAKAKYELLTERGVGVWVMEPLRGGRLTRLSERDTDTLRALRPDESAAAWAFRFLQALPNVKLILSGMSDMSQMVENIGIFEKERPLNEKELDALLGIAEGMKSSIPCTACRYCCDGCPIGLDIPMLISTYNEIRFAPAVNSVMRIEALPREKQPSACLGCGKCAAVCPQKIDIPKELKGLSDAFDKMPKWADICREREEIARRNLEAKAARS